MLATLGIFGAIDLGKIIAWFMTLIILSIVGVVILKVFAKKGVSDAVENDKNYVKITKEEYAMLVDKASKYDKLMANSNNNTEK